MGDARRHRRPVLHRRGRRRRLARRHHRAADDRGRRPRLVAAARAVVDPRLPAATAGAHRARRAVRARLLHRSHADLRGTPRRSGQRRAARQREAGARGHAPRGLAARRRARLPQLARHRRRHPAPPRLPERSGEPAVPLRAAAGLHLPAGGRGQPGQAAPRAVLAGAEGLVPAGRRPRRLARGRHLRLPRRAVVLHAAGDAPHLAARRPGARPHRQDADRGQRGHGRHRDPQLLLGVPPPQRRRRRDRHRRRPADRRPARRARRRPAAAARGRPPRGASARGRRDREGPRRVEPREAAADALLRVRPDAPAGARRPRHRDRRAGGLDHRPAARGAGDGDGQPADAPHRDRARRRLRLDRRADLPRSAARPHRRARAERGRDPRRARRRAARVGVGPARAAREPLARHRDSHHPPRATCATSISTRCTGGSVSPCGRRGRLASLGKRFPIGRRRHERSG